MLEVGVKPEIEIFDAGMIDNANYLIKKGYIKEPAYFQFVLGAAGGAQATVKEPCIFARLLASGIKMVCFWYWQK